MLSVRFIENLVELSEADGQRRCEVAGLEFSLPRSDTRLLRGITAHPRLTPLLATGVNVKASRLWGGRGKTTEFELNSLGTEDEYAVFMHRYPQGTAIRMT